MTPSPQPPRIPGVSNVPDLDLGDLPDPANRAGTLSAPCTHCGPIHTDYPMGALDGG